MTEVRQLRFVAPPGACRLLLLRHGETTPARGGVAVPLLDVAAIYMTPLVRTAQTAAPLGEWEGGEYRRRVAANDPIAARVVAELRGDVIPGAEAMGRFAAHVYEGVERGAAAHPDQTEEAAR